MAINPVKHPTANTPMTIPTISPVKRQTNVTTFKHENIKTKDKINTTYIVKTDATFRHDNRLLHSTSAIEYSSPVVTLCTDVLNVLYMLWMSKLEHKELDGIRRASVDGHASACSEFDL